MSGTGSIICPTGMAPNPLGPWEYRGVLRQSDKRYQGPGHHSFVRDPKDSSWWIVDHRWEGKKGTGPYSDDRRIAIQPVAYGQHGQIVPIKMMAE